jgi:hypothetical protein
MFELRYYMKKAKYPTPGHRHTKVLQYRTWEPGTMGYWSDWKNVETEWE